MIHATWILKDTIIFLSIFLIEYLYKWNYSLSIEVSNHFITVLSVGHFKLNWNRHWFWNTFFLPIFIIQYLTIYRDSPVSAVFWSPRNRTIIKTSLIGDWFSSKIAILDFWIFKVPFFGYFNQQETTLLNNLQFMFYVTASRIINQLDSWKIIIFNYLCTYAEKKTQLQKIGKNWKHLKKSIWKNWNSFKKFGKKTH
jgi:hypothetical protein